MPSPISWAIHYHQRQENASRNGSYTIQFLITLKFWLSWDSTDSDDIRLLQKYVESNGSIVHLPSNTAKDLISLWNYMNILIKRERPVEQKCNVLYFLLIDQWFKLTAHDMRTALVNAALEYHEFQPSPETFMFNLTSPSSPSPKRPLSIWSFPIHERYQTR